MSTPHKFADVIKAWADGKWVQWAHHSIFKNDNTFWCDWVETKHGQPTFDLSYLWRVKPEPIKWEKEREAFARGERIQWRSTCKQHAGMVWRDVPAQSPLMGPAFDEPTNEFRIPHKWQAEMDAFARGETIQYRDADPAIWLAYGCQDWTDFNRNTRPNPFWATTATREYRVKPKTVKTRIRVAAMGEPNGEGRVWTWPVHTDERAAQAERNQHFLCWLGGWHEVERPEPPAEGTLGVGWITDAKISQASITTEETPLGALGALHAMGVDAAKPGPDQAVVWYSNGEWPPSGGFSWGIR